jgi:hypothetical protein
MGVIDDIGDPPDQHDPYEAPIVAWAKRNGYYQEQHAEASP